MKNYIKILYLFLFSCSSIEDKPDPARNWAYLDKAPIYLIQRDGSRDGYLGIIDTTRKEVSICSAAKSNDLLENEYIFRTHIKHLSDFRFAILGNPARKLRYERGMKPDETILLEHNIQNMKSKEYQYPGIILHIMDEYNPNSINIIGWNTKRDSIFYLVLDHNFKESARFHLEFPYKAIDIQRFSVSDSGNYLAIVYYGYNENSSDTYIDVFKRGDGRIKKIHSFISIPYENIREAFFSRDERYLYLSDIQSAKTRILELGSDTKMRLIHDPKINLDLSIAEAHYHPIPGRANDILIRPLLTYELDKEELLRKEKMKIIRYNPEFGVLNEYDFDIPIINYRNDMFLNDSTFVIFEYINKQKTFWHEYHYDTKSGFRFIKTVSYDLIDHGINSFGYLIFNGRGRWFKN